MRLESTDSIVTMAEVCISEICKTERQDSFDEVNESPVLAQNPISHSNQQIIDLTITEDDVTLSVAECESTGIKKEDNIEISNDTTGIKQEFIVVQNPDYQSEMCNDDPEMNEEVEVLPPPLTLDDPRPSRIRRRKSTKKSKKQIDNEANLDAFPLSHTRERPSSQRLQRSCKNKIIDYSEDYFMSIDTTPVQKTETDEKDQEFVTKELHACDLCDSFFKNARGLKMHKKWKHTPKDNKFGYGARSETKLDVGEISEIDVKLELPVRNSLNEKRKKLYPCPRCGRKFSFKNNMRRHLRIHLGITESHECSYCKKICTSKNGLIAHIRFIHTGERPFTCKVCFADFATNSDLNRHMSKHSDVKRYKCPDCGKGFKQAAALKQHIQRKFSEKSWHCGVCDKRFASKHSLKCHMVVHTKIKLYECETCQRKFAHKLSLEAHMRVHAGLMPFSCSVCGKKFAHLSNRNRHVRQVHK